MAASGCRRPGSRSCSGRRGASAPTASSPGEILDLLTYGTSTPLPFATDAPDRRFSYDIGRLPGFLDGRPGFWWSINGRIVPHVPMFVVAEGDVVVIVEDVLTTGGQVLEVAKGLQSAGAKIEKIVGVIDRMEGAREAIEKAVGTRSAAPGVPASAWPASAGAQPSTPSCPRRRCRCAAAAP